MRLQGVVVPFITPLNEYEEVIDQDVETLMQYLIENGIENVFLLGTMGEGPLITNKQKEKLINKSISAADGRVRIIVNVTDASTARVLENIRIAEGSGADVVASSLPIYLPLDSQDQIIDFYSELATHAKPPFLMYDMPRLVNTDISIKTYQVLSSHENIIGMKDSSNNFHRLRELIAIFRNNRDFALFSGDEWSIDAALLSGADGFVPGIGCLVPALCVDLYKSCIAHDIEKAHCLQDSLISLFAIYGENTMYWDAGMKEALLQMGLISNSHVAKPIQKKIAGMQQDVAAVLQKAGLLQ